ncbi:hypothetical protein CASFOL_020861 [Castilleja foliolosa]|uniref:Uncharacterized protein n=1 Tax=Castilleja foliolosa TaxID=1961234 RepID=A0ABD3D3F5_9LAMI
MGKFLPCPLPCHPDNRRQDSDQSSQPTIKYPNSDHSTSSSNSSLSSQSSLPSVPSLTRHPHTLDHAGGGRRCLATLHGHSSFIFSIAAAGKYLFSGASNGEIRIWDTQSQNYVVLDGRSAVKSIVILNDKLFTSHHDHKIRVWKIEDCSETQMKFKLITTLPTVNDRCMKIFSPKNYVEIRRHKKCTWVHHVDTVSGLALSKDGLFIYSVSWDRTMKVWRTRDFKCVESIQNAHDDAINAVVLSSYGLVFTGSADKLIKIWEIDDKNKHHLVGVLEKHKSAINALALSEDGSVLYSGACDRSIIVWDGAATGWAAAGALRGHKKGILCLAVVKDILCSGSADKTVRIWRGSGNSYSCLAVFEGHKSPVKCLTASLDFAEKNSDDLGNSYLVYSGGLDFEIKVWQIWVNS